MKRILFIISIIILFILLSLRFYRDYFQYRLLKIEVERLTQQYNNTKQEREKLEKLQQEGSQTDILEKWARTILGMKKQGEEIILITPINNIHEVSTTTSTLPFNYSSSNFSFVAPLFKIWYNFWHRFMK